MVRDPDMFTLFNVPLTKSEKCDEKCKSSELIMDIFPFTKRMSTYLVAFIISDFANITNLTSSGLKVSN